MQTPETPDSIDPPDVSEPAPSNPDIISTAPSILASPDAPSNQSEADRAVPQSQSDPLGDLLRRPVGLPPSTPGAGGPTVSGPRTGGGNEAVPGGGTRRGNSRGVDGWTLSPSTSPGEGYDGLNMDIRCREANRTHENCPEYLKKFRGRDASGWESFNGRAGTGTDRSQRQQAPASRRSLGLPIGDNSVNAGGPSSTIFDDAPEVSFDREFLNKPIIIEEEPGRLRDLLKQPDDRPELPDWMQTETLPEPEPDPEPDPESGPEF